MPSGTIKFVSVRSSQGNLSLFEIIRALVLLSRKFRCNLAFYESENFSNSSLHRVFESEILGFLFTTKNTPTWGVKCEKLDFRKS